MNISAARNLLDLCHVVARVRDDGIGEGCKFADDAAVAQVDPIMSRCDWKLAGQFVEKNQQASGGIFCLPLGEHRRKPKWATETMIRPARVMQKNIGVANVLERARKFAGLGVEFGDRAMMKGSGRRCRALDDEEPNARSIARPMAMQQPTESADSAKLWRKPRADNDERPRAHGSLTKREIVPQNFRV